MKSIITNLLLLALIYQAYSGCIGVPLMVNKGIDFNCRSLCCSIGFVQDTFSGTNCVSCASVGLLNCAKCGLYATASSG